MPKGACSIAHIDGLKISVRRAIVFLVCNGGLSGKSGFDKLPKARDREVRNRFDHWIDGKPYPKYYHGWDNPKYKQCFSFRWKDKRVHQRLYGFICNPKRDDPRFQLCVLVFYSAKTDENTDFTVLDEINKLRSDASVASAIQRYLEGK
jgi:hypothetical protein